MTSSTTYAIRVAGHLDTHWTTRLDDVTIAHHADGTTTITATVADQSQLHGILNGVRDIGAVLIEVRPAKLTRPA